MISFELLYGELVFISSSAVINIILAALIVCRLVYHRRCVRNSLGVDHGSPYTYIITMCVESSALMVISSGLFAILALVPHVTPSVTDFIHDIIPHIYVGGLELNFF